MDPPHPGAGLGADAVSAHRVTLHLPGQAVREVAVVEAKDAATAAAHIARRHPFLPPAYVWIGDRALAGLLAPAAAPSVASDPGLTPGQRAWRERVARQRRAERWRQHWIDKANAKG